MAIRLSGLASGLDTEAIISDLMKAENIKVENQEKEKQLLQWKKEDYQEINTKLLAVRTALTDLKLQSSFIGNTVQSGDEGIVTATAGASASDGKYVINVINLASGVNVASSEALGSEDDVSSLASQFGISGTVTFTLEGTNGSQSFTFSAEDDNIYEVIGQINDADLGITASYDSGVDRIFLSTSDTGSDVTIDITADAEGFLRDTLKLYSGDLATSEVPVNLGTGEDAEIEYNGITGLTFSSNQFTLNNMNFNLNSEGTTTLTINNDNESTVEKIQTFVEAYNSVMELVSSKLSESRDSDYEPLTDEEREEMSDDEIEMWEERARAGLLKGDYTLNSIYRQLRSTATSLGLNLSEDNDYTSLSAIGITTSSDWGDGGKLYIDEDELLAALADDAEGVMELFIGTEDDDGIADRLYDIVNNSITTITNKAGSSSSGSIVDSSYLGQDIERINERIEELQERLDAIEESYWDKFTAMEEALQTLNESQSWLEQTLGSLG